MYIYRVKSIQIWNQTLKSKLCINKSNITKIANVFELILPSSLVISQISHISHGYY